MAETSKVLCPDKTVLIPDLRAGCSLAASITAADVRLIKQRYPGVPVVDLRQHHRRGEGRDRHLLHQRQRRAGGRGSVGRRVGTDRVILLPDEFLARNVARQTDINIIAWQGRCEVHERFDAEDIAEVREAWPDAEILAHPECPAEVLELADFAGSTTAMSDYVVKRRPRQVVLITECSMADNIAATRRTPSSCAPATSART